MVSSPASPLQQELGVGVGEGLVPGGDTMPLAPGTMPAKVMEHILREIMAEEDIQYLPQRLMSSDLPYFIQFEDSPPPGYVERVRALVEEEQKDEAAPLEPVRPRAVLSVCNAHCVVLMLQSLALPDPGQGTTARSAVSDPCRAIWDEVQETYGQVDLEAFKTAAAEVLDGMLLDVMDEVVSGQLNWMRPMQRTRARKSTRQFTNQGGL
eukprot:3570548-Amphidinium_carterae.1